MKRAIIKLIIIELCLLIALSGQKISDNLQEASAVDTQVAASQISEFIENGTAVSEATATADNNENTITIEIPRYLLEKQLDFIISQAKDLDINVWADEESIIYTISADEQTSIVSHTSNYINNTLTNNTIDDNKSLLGIVSNDSSNKLTFLVDSDTYDNNLDSEEIEGYFLLLQFQNGFTLEEVSLNVCIQDSSSDEIFLEYDYIEKLMQDDSDNQ